MYFEEQLALEPCGYSFSWRSQNFVQEDGSSDYDSKVTGFWVTGFNWQSNHPLTSHYAHPLHPCWRLS